MNSLFLFICAFFVNNDNVNYVSDNKMNEFFSKDSVTILITDSGYGGLSVFAEIEKKFHTLHPFKKVKLVFYNSQPKSDLGYNKMKSLERKVKVFNNALNGMIKWYNPDIILIACNTLSVIYESTGFSKSAKIPVIGIVDFGVEMILDSLKNDKEKSIIIFGTETTIAQNTHKKNLILKGIDSNRIITQPCKDLAVKIESAPEGEAVKDLISQYSKEAVSNIKNRAPGAIAGLCCTHYGYCMETFYNSLNEAGLKDIKILDPNSRMAGYIFPKEQNNKFKYTEIELEIVSRVKVEPQEMSSLGSLIQKVSRPSVEAFKNYKFKEDLFKVE